MTRAVHRTLGWFAAHAGSRRPRDRLRDYFPTWHPALAGAIERYRALGLWGADPVIRREGYDRLHAATSRSGRSVATSPSRTASTPKFAEQAIA